MTALPADAFVPVPVRWRNVNASDTFVAPDGKLWHVAKIATSRAALAVTAQYGDRQFSRDVDPDDVVTVLIAVPERDAVELARDVLGARLIERRTTAPPEEEQSQ